MMRITKWLTAAGCLALAACSADPSTFVSYSQKHDPAGVFDPNKAPRRTDALALNYANGVEEIFRARSTGARYTREASDTVLAGLAAFTGAAKTLDIGTAKLARMGLASAGILQLRTIFDARGRSTAYAEAAERIHSAIKDYVAHNLNEVSESYITPNGWTLVNVVQSNIDIVSKILNGHLPSADALAQASEPMTDKGALPQAVGSTPRNNIPANTTTALTTRLQRALTKEVRDPTTVSAEAFARMKAERDRLQANMPEDIDFNAELEAVVDDKTLSDTAKTTIFQNTVKGADLAGKVAADAGSLSTFFQEKATDKQRTDLGHALKAAKNMAKP
ncbi:MAG: hypothetical protein ABR611_05995 [Chthoniobacterales bacterium]